MIFISHQLEDTPNGLHGLSIFRQQLQLQKKENIMTDGQRYKRTETLVITSASFAISTAVAAVNRICLLYSEADTMNFVSFLQLLCIVTRPVEKSDPVLNNKYAELARRHWPRYARRCWQLVPLTSIRPRGQIPEERTMSKKLVK